MRPEPLLALIGILLATSPADAGNGLLFDQRDRFIGSPARHRMSVHRRAGVTGFVPFHNKTIVMSNGTVVQDGAVLHGFVPFRSKAFAARRGFGAQGFAFGFPSFGDFGFPVVTSAEPSAPQIVVLSAGGPPAPPPRTSDEGRFTVETTPVGVTIVRGPGSQHTAGR